MDLLAKNLTFLNKIAQDILCQVPNLSKAHKKGLKKVAKLSRELIITKIKEFYTQAKKDLKPVNKTFDILINPINQELPTVQENNKLQSLDKVASHLESNKIILNTEQVNSDKESNYPNQE